MGNVHALTWPRELFGQDQLWSAMDMSFFCFSVLDSQFLPCGWLLLLPLLFLIPILGSVDLCFLHWAAFGPSMHTVLHLKYGNNIYYVAEALARLSEMMLSPTFGI